MKLTPVLVVLCLALHGCSTPFEGIRLRARSPAIDEAYRKLRLTVDLDGYTVERADAGSRWLETGWREVREEELPPGERQNAGVQSVRLTLRLAPRGTLYDVHLGVLLRSGISGAGEARPAPTGHPLVLKWRTILGRLLERESREED